MTITETLIYLEAGVTKLKELVISKGSKLTNSQKQQLDLDMSVMNWQFADWIKKLEK